MTIDACISSRRLDGLSVVVRVAPGVCHDPDRVAAVDPPRRWSLLREGDHAEACLQTMPAMRHSARSIVTLKSSLWRSKCLLIGSPPMASPKAAESSTIERAVPAAKSKSAIVA
jgi:hypothetical protein